jgi:spermidine/putrescine transport system substrate-binding protein
MSRILISLALVCGMTLACTKKTETSTNTHEVNLLIWGNYISPEMQEKFEKETGIKINISNYSSNEELLAKVQMGSSGIDVAVPSDYMVAIMAKMNLLEPLSKEKIPNQILIEDDFLKQYFDVENRFSLPYSWTTTGIAFNKDLYKGSLTSWKELFESKELKGKLALLDDVREVTGAALKMHGASVNTTKAAELAKAKNTLLEAKKNVKMFTSDSVDILKNKEVVAAQAYSSDALQAAAQSDGKIEFFLPKEGSVYTIDNFVILKGAKHSEEAHKLINFLLSNEAEISKIKNVMSGPTHKNIQAELPKEFQNNKVLFPGKEVLKKLEHIEDLGNNSKIYDDLWRDIKTE